MFNIEIFWNFDTGVQKNIFCFFLKKWEASFTTIFEKKKNFSRSINWPNFITWFCKIAQNPQENTCDFLKGHIL